MAGIHLEETNGEMLAAMAIIQKSLSRLYHQRNEMPKIS